MKEDKRPDPKPKKHPHLWQSYQYWDSHVQQRKKHVLRIDSIRKGKSNLNLELAILFYERDKPMLEAGIKYGRETMINYGHAMTVWDHVTTIKGLRSGSLAAQLLAQVDDISKFPTVSKFWRFSGYAVINGKAERGAVNGKRHYNGRLKSIGGLICEQFIRHQTPHYVDDYYHHKEQYRKKYPEKIKVNGKWKYNDGHIAVMAERKVIKLFLSHLWDRWRKLEGLPVRVPYPAEYLGHTTISKPQDYGWPKL